MIDTTSENLLSLAEAVKLLPAGRGGRRVHFSTVLRWVLDGAKGPDGTRVRLEGVRLGGRWLTSRQALQRFVEKLTPAAPEHPAPRTAGQCTRAAARAGAAL